MIAPIMPFRILQKTDKTFCVPGKPTFKALNSNISDNFRSQNIKKILWNSHGDLEQILYIKPQSVTQALKQILTTSYTYIHEQIMYKNLHSKREIEMMIADLEKSPQIGNILVKSLFGVGSFAFAFETDDDKILKITRFNHYPDDRKPDWFDVPTYKSGRLSGENDIYYYLEEKLTQQGFSQAKIADLCERIEASGYILTDVMTLGKDIYMKRQFGKSKDGQLYLLDPGCAIKKNSQKSNPLKNLFNYVKGILFGHKNNV